MIASESTIPLTKWQQKFKTIRPSTMIKFILQRLLKKFPKLQILTSYYDLTCTDLFVLYFLVYISFPFVGILIFLLIRYFILQHVAYIGYWGCLLLFEILSTCCWQFLFEMSKVGSWIGLWCCTKFLLITFILFIYYFYILYTKFIGINCILFRSIRLSL